MSNIEDEGFKEAILHPYQKKFLERFKEGREKGEQKRAREVAKRMIIDGIPLEKVSRMAELDLKVIQELAEEVGANLHKKL